MMVGGVRVVTGIAGRAGIALRVAEILGGVPEVTASRRVHGVLERGIRVGACVVCALVVACGVIRIFGGMRVGIMRLRGSGEADGNRENGCGERVAERGVCFHVCKIRRGDGGFIQRKIYPRKV